MAKSIILNRVNGKNHMIMLPCAEADAIAVATDLLEGEYQVLKFGSEKGTETEISYREVQVMVKNTTSKAKSYLNIKVKTSKTEENIFSAVLGLTVNGVVVDEAFIISDRLITL